jgi:hypothetical protein
MRAFDRDLIRGRHYGQRSCEPRKQAEHMAAPTSLRPHWQQVHKLILEEADVAAVSWQFRLALLKDAKFDLATTSA